VFDPEVLLEIVRYVWGKGNREQWYRLLAPAMPTNTRVVDWVLSEDRLDAIVKEVIAALESNKSSLNSITLLDSLSANPRICD
jgi:hypothetical protein